MIITKKKALFPPPLPPPPKPPKMWFHIISICSFFLSFSPSVGREGVEMYLKYGGGLHKEKHVGLGNFWGGGGIKMRVFFEPHLPSPHPALQLHPNCAPPRREGKAGGEGVSNRVKEVRES